MTLFLAALVIGLGLAVLEWRHAAPRAPPRAALVLLGAAVGGKLLGVTIAGRALGWDRRETRVIGWLLQTKALIMIIFANVLLDRQVISSAAFTALLLMAVASTMLTIPRVTSLLRAEGPESKPRG